MLVLKALVIVIAMIILCAASGYFMYWVELKISKVKNI